jgi:hypothetical protein
MIPTWLGEWWQEVDQGRIYCGMCMVPMDVAKHDDAWPSPPRGTGSARGRRG